MSYNTDFLMSAMIILMLILWQFTKQKRPNDLNNKVFLGLVVLASLDVSFEMISTYFINIKNRNLQKGDKKSFIYPFSLTSHHDISPF